MLITDDKKIADIQREFNAKFPNLKLEFYSEHHETHEGSSQNQLLDSKKTIGEIRNIHKTGDISVNGHLKVSTLEQMMYEKYGLNVQVWRKSGSIWLQTTSTDDWTLTEQNERGKTR